MSYHLSYYDTGLKINDLLFYQFLYKKKNKEAKDLYNDLFDEENANKGVNRYNLIYGLNIDTLITNFDLSDKLNNKLFLKIENKIEKPSQKIALENYLNNAFKAYYKNNYIIKNNNLIFKDIFENEKDYFCNKKISFSFNLVDDKIYFKYDWGLNYEYKNTIYDEFKIEYKNNYRNVKLSDETKKEIFSKIINEDDKVIYKIGNIEKEYTFKYYNNKINFDSLTDIDNKEYYYLNGQSLRDYYKKMYPKFKNVYTCDNNMPIVQLYARKQKKYLSFPIHVIKKRCDNSLLNDFQNIKFKFNNIKKPLYFSDTFNLISDFVNKNDIFKNKEINNIEKGTDIKTLGYEKLNLFIPSFISNFNNNEIADLNKDFAKLHINQAKRDLKINIYYEKKAYNIKFFSKALKELASKLGINLISLRNNYKEDENKKRIDNFKNYLNYIDKNYSLLCILSNKNSSVDNKLRTKAKQLLAKHNIISQFVYIDDKNKDFYVRNTLLGLLIKNNIYLWRLKEKLNSDCVIGIDLSREKKISFIGTIIIDKDGIIDLLPLEIKNNVLNDGEKIDIDELKNILKLAIKTYKERNGKNPEHITIHRDGYFNEDLMAIDDFFADLNIKYDVVEIIKIINIRMLKLENNNINTEKMIYYKNQEAYFCTTDTNLKMGIASSFKVIQKTNNLKFTDIVKDICNLRFLNYHYSDNNRAKFPVSVNYSHKISNAIRNETIIYPQNKNQGLSFL